jgi:hypothetical protein
MAALGLGLAAALVAAILVPHQILAAGRAAVPPQADVGAPRTVHPRRHRAHDEMDTRKRQLRSATD